MGCFNVVCSVSNLSINHGTRVAFIPLMPNSYGGIHKIKPSSSLIYPNCYFNPLSLPIFGEYNDYGSLENIEKNENTKTIEHFFGISIEQFVGILTCGRDIADTYGELFQAYAKHKVMMDDYEIKFNERFLTKLGFTQSDDKVYVYKDFPVYVKIIEGGYELFNKEHERLCGDTGYGVKKDLIKKFEKHTGYILLVSEENQEKVKLIRTLSGMFVHGDIYKELVDYQLNQATVADGYVTQKVLETLGFVLKEEEGNDKYYEKPSASLLVRKNGSSVSILNKHKKDVAPYLYQVTTFAERWEKATGERLNIAPFKEVYMNDVAFDEFKDWLNERKESNFAVMLEEIKAKMSDPNLPEEDREGLIDLAISFKEMANRDFQIDRHEYGRFFEGWKYFQQLYIPLIKKGKLKEAFSHYKAFYFSMYSCNRFFFPGMNGEQHGNSEASKMLLEKSLGIVNDELKERDYEF